MSMPSGIGSLKVMLLRKAYECGSKRERKEITIERRYGKNTDGKRGQFWESSKR
jgi:hypothetical protein